MKENKFNNGDVVFTKSSPRLKLLIMRSIDAIYYCKILANPKAREALYFERELLAEHDPARNW